MAGKDITFTIKGIADLDVKSLVKNVSDAQDSLAKLKLPTNLQDSFSTLFSQINKQITDFEGKASKTWHNISDVRDAERSFSTLQNLIEHLQNRLSKIDDVKVSLKDGSKLANDLKKITDQISSFNNKAQDLSKTVEKVQNTMSKGLAAKINVNELIEAAQRGEDFSKTLTKLKYASTIDTRIKVLDEKEFSSAEEAVKKLDIALVNARVSRDAIAKSKGTGTEEYGTAVVYVKELDSALKNAKERAEQFNKNAEGITKVQIVYNNLKKAISELNIDGINKSVEELHKEFDKLSPQGAEQVADAIQRAGVSAEDARHDVKGFGVALSEAATNAQELETVNQQMQQLQQRFIHFFSLANGWNLMRRAIQNAFNTVKDLDREMTEIAVVTEMTLDEVWAQRGVYSQVATEMGAATLDMVAASKLYYQQGQQWM